MIIIKEKFQEFKVMGDDEFPDSLVELAKSIMPMIIARKGYCDKDLLNHLIKTKKLAESFSIFKNFNIARLFILTIALGIDFCDKKKYIDIETELNDIEISEFRRMQKVYERFLSDDLLDLNEKPDEILYSILQYLA